MGGGSLTAPAPSNLPTLHSSSNLARYFRSRSASFAIFFWARDRSESTRPAAERLSAEQVAGAACDEALAYLAADAPVGLNLADQLLLPLALAGQGRFGP